MCTRHRVSQSIVDAFLSRRLNQYENRMNIEHSHTVRKQETERDREHISCVRFSFVHSFSCCFLICTVQFSCNTHKGDVMSLENRCQRLQNRRTKMYNNNWICISYTVRNTYVYQSVYVLPKSNQSNAITPSRHSIYITSHDTEQRREKKKKNAQ